MIIVLKSGITKKQEAGVLQEIRKRGYKPHVMRGVARTVVGAIGDELTHASLDTLATQFPNASVTLHPMSLREIFLVLARQHRGDAAKEAA